ncbi:hypothetical protein AAHB56_18880, partial [Bacillus thuringiensis]
YASFNASDKVGQPSELNQVACFAFIVKRLRVFRAPLDKEVERVQKKLSNQGFVAKAPAAVIEGERAKEQDYLEKREAVRQRLADLEK